MPHMVSRDQDGRLTGFLAPAILESLQLFRYRFNVTLMFSDKIGEVMNGSDYRYDGCLGLVQRNESDTLISSSGYPILGRGLIHSSVTSSGHTSMVSAYNNQFFQSDTDVMDAFSSFTRNCLLMIAFMNFMLALLIMMMFAKQYVMMNHQRNVLTRKRLMPKRTMVRKAASKTMAVATGCILKQHSAYQIKLQSPSFRLTLLLWSILMFVVSLFFSSLIKTEVVVFGKPDTISSYGDLLAHPNMRPVWNPALNSHLEFADARRGSPAQKVWHRAENMGIAESRLGIDLPTIRSNVRNVLHRRSVWFVPSFVTQAIITNFCAFSRSVGSYSDMNMWIRSDPDARETLQVIMKSAALSYANSKMLDFVATSIIEHQLRGQATKLMEYSRRSLLWGG